MRKINEIQLPPEPSDDTFADRTKEQSRYLYRIASELILIRHLVESLCDGRVTLDPVAMQQYEDSGGGWTP
jgi:hypothetical protein